MSKCVIRLKFEACEKVKQNFSRTRLITKLFEVKRKIVSYVTYIQTWYYIHLLFPKPDQ